MCVTCVFHLSGRPSFKPTFQECEDTVRGIMDTIVLSVAGLPRVGSNLAGTSNFATSSSSNTAAVPGGHNSSVIPTTMLQVGGLWMLAPPGTQRHACPPPCKAHAHAQAHALSLLLLPPPCRKTM